MNKILFVHQQLIPFVEKDLEILKSKHIVKEFIFKETKDIPSLFIKVLYCNLTFSWFGKLNAFFAVLFSKLLVKKCIVLAGGDDVAKKTAVGRKYGIFSHPVKKWFGHFIFKYADLIIAISKYNYKEVVENTPALAKKIRLIYHGFDSNKFYKMDGIEKEKIVATVGHISYENCWRKGFELIKTTACLMPDLKFYIIGPADDSSINKLKDEKPANLILPGGLYGDDLIRILSKTSVYLQVSEWESFGCALAEAMLCECVPVVFNGTALPEVTGDCGYYINKLDPKELSDKIKVALSDTEMGQKARQRIIKEFPLERRKVELLKVIKELGAEG